MILVVDLCYNEDSLSSYEFVDPVKKILRKAQVGFDVVHYSRLEDPFDYDKIILCGTALKDRRCLEDLDWISWIGEWKDPMLGISTGAAAICSALGGRIVPRVHIGMEEIKITVDTPLLGERRKFAGFHLHSFGVDLPEGLKEIAEGCEAFISRDHQIYGILFSPEVRNDWIIERFASGAVSNNSRRHR